MRGGIDEGWSLDLERITAEFATGARAMLLFSALNWGDDPAVYALEHARVALANGPMFGASVGRGHARLNFACAPELLEEAITRLAAAA